MTRHLMFFVAGIVLSQPVIGAPPQTKAERDREISEIVFQHYPPRALAAGEQGAVFFVVDIDKDARATSCEVTHGSGHPLLDAETCYLVVQNAEFKSARDPSGKVVKQRTEGVVNWTIPGRVPVPINPVTLTAAAKPEKQVCQKNLRAGTLSAVERVCMTPTEWAKQGDNMKEPWREMQGKGFTSRDICSGAGCDSTLGQAAHARGLRGGEQ